MTFRNVSRSVSKCICAGLSSIALFQFAFGATLAAAAPPPPPADARTTTPIKHLIVIIGENRSFDHVFATYKPKHGESVYNLLSEGIVKSDGTPGFNFQKAVQKAAADEAPNEFLLSPPKSSLPGNVLPAPLVGGAFDSYIPGDSVALAEETENGLPSSYYASLVSGGTGLTKYTPDTRIHNVNSLPPGPFQLTSSTLDYTAYAASPVHRFYQMWQQLDCSLAHISPENPSGCDARLFPWVEVTVGAGTNGVMQPANFSTEYSTAAYTTGEGSTAMAFYNMQHGDVPYFKSLADNYAMSDNFHQSVNGGTGANHIMLGHGDMIWFSDGNGHAAEPPHNTEVWGGTLNAGTVDEVENPNPAAETNNWYTEDGYGGGGYGSAVYGGGSYSNCADSNQPGVAPVLNYLKEMRVNSRCEAGHYYLLNNYNPGYFGQGENAYIDTNPAKTPFTIPPSSVPSIGDDMISHNISWKYYGDQWNDYAGSTKLGIPEDKYEINYGAVGSPNGYGNANIEFADEYCNICNPFQYDSSIMANPTVRKAHIQDTTDSL